MSKIQGYNPQFYREHQQSLNGLWDFVFNSEPKQKINVPYCPESKLSGIGYTDFIKHCQYERVFKVENLSTFERVFIHFGAVDYKAEVYVNDKKVGEHEGGYTSFCVECTDVVTEGENNLRVLVYDDINMNAPSGKQSPKKNSFGCFYTRVTGIWQDVWIERTPINYIKSVKYFPHIDDASVDVELVVEGEGDIKVEVFYKEELVGSAQSSIAFKKTLPIKLAAKHLWEIENGRLYDVKITYGDDIVESYFGLREVCFEGEKFLLNGRSVFQRFVLDQGYNPDGLYTPPSDDWRVQDIARAMRLGFNGIRLHQKVFSPRFLYHCDRMGCMVWGEFPSWGMKYDSLEGLATFIKEWVETVERDFNHPSIVLWCPLNEVWKDLNEPKKSRDVRYIDAVYSLTKIVDNTRPCVDVSGGFHGHQTDLYDFHCYEEYDKIKQYLNILEREAKLDVPLLYDEKEKTLRYVKGLPVNVSEFGGIRFSKVATTAQTNTINECAVTCEDSWGYGQGESNENAFVDRYEKLANLFLNCSVLSGFCYTQLYDIEQEENGFFTYDRSPKLSEDAMDKIAACNKQIAAIEKEKR